MKQGRPPKGVGKLKFSFSADTLEMLREAAESEDTSISAMLIPSHCRGLPRSGRSAEGIGRGD